MINLIIYPQSVKEIPLTFLIKNVFSFTKYERGSLNLSKNARILFSIFSLFLVFDDLRGLNLKNSLFKSGRYWAIKNSKNIGVLKLLEINGKGEGDGA